MIKGYKQGSGITILNNCYRYGRRQEDGSYSKDFMQIVYRDNTTGEKKMETIYNPDYEFYMLKDDIITDHNLFFVEKKINILFHIKI